MKGPFRLLIGFLCFVLFGAAFVVSVPAVAAKSACLCRCTVEAPDPGPQFTELTLGRSTCTADCSAACDGAGNIARNDDGSAAARLVQIACVPGSNDCEAGGFDVYEGVACVLQFDPDVSKRPADLAAFPEVNGQKPTCVVPVTARNANIECQQYGGIARGGTCGFFEQGQNIDGYFKSRPFLGGSPQTKNYTGSFPTFQDWAELADFNEPSDGLLPATAGICTRFGVKCGGGPTYEGFDCADNLTPIPHYDYVCIKPKSNTCGTVPPPSGQDPVLPARSYSCQGVTGWTSQQLSDKCFPAGGSYTDLCVQAGTRCCQGGTAFDGCLADSDCSTDGTRVCEGESFETPEEFGLGGTTLIPVTQGQCVWKTVCDPDNEDRRCRSASDVERESPRFCSPESVLPSEPSRCPRAGESCCIARNQNAVSGCAADYLVEAGPSSIWNDFGCVPAEEIPPSQFGANGTVVGIEDRVASSPGVTGFGTDPSTYNGSGQSHCLTRSIVRQNGAGSVARCSPGRVCCNTEKLAAEVASTGGDAPFLSSLGDRLPLGTSPCGGASGFSCRSTGDLVPVTEAGAQLHGFPTREAYLAALATHPGCRVTPLESNPAANAQCVANALCCHPSMVFDSEACRSDEDCGSDGLRCDTQLHLCIDASLASAVSAGDGCFAEATSGMAEETVLAILAQSSAPSDQFSCQAVADDDSRASTQCFPRGCDRESDDFGVVMKCCAPGVGQTAAATAQGGRSQAVARGPFELQISDCIRSGNCTLDDIVYTGAQFANFLIAIAGAIFFAIFVYGGFKYLTSGYTHRYTEAKEMIIQATWAMILLMGAFVFIQFIQRSLTG